MSGSRIVTLATLRLAACHTLSVSPTGAGSPLGRCVAPGGGCVNIFGLVGAIHLSGGQPSSPNPYKAPDAAWSTFLTDLAASTASTIGARSAASAASAAPRELPVTAAAKGSSTVTATTARTVRLGTMHLAHDDG